MNVDERFGTRATIKSNRFDKFQGIVVRSMYNRDIQTTEGRRNGGTEIESVDRNRPGLLVASVDDEFPETSFAAKLGHQV